MTDKDIEKKIIIKNDEQSNDTTGIQLNIDSTEHKSTSDEDINKHKLWKLLKQTQCPMMPIKYEDGKGKVSAYYFLNEFWIKDEAESNRCRKVIFSDDSLKETVKDEAELMLAVDRYIGYVRINKSFEIHAKLLNALEEQRGDMDSDTDNDTYMMLIPDRMDRFMLIATIIVTWINAYFIGISMLDAKEGRYRSKFMNILAFVVALSDITLYANILFGRIISLTISFLCNYRSNQSTYYQEKAIAIQVRNLSTVSILRYLPSFEMITGFLGNLEENMSSYFEYFKERRKYNPQNFYNVLESLFAIPRFFVESVAPFLALFGVMVKLRQLEFDLEGEPFIDWNFREYVIFIAFVNQIAGLRVLRYIKTENIQRFVFSGHDVWLNKDEKAIMDKWWDVVMISAVSNLALHSFDNMVFWFSLNPKRIQLLLKNHVVVGRDKEMQKNGGLLKYIQCNDHLLDEYDQYILKRLQMENEEKGVDNLNRSLSKFEPVEIGKNEESDFCYYPKLKKVEMSLYQSERLKAARPSNPYRNDVFC